MKNFFKSLTNSPNLFFIELPSFDSESMICVERKKGIDNYYIIYQKAIEMIYSSEKENIEIVKYEKKNSLESFTILELLFEAALSGTKYSVHKNFILDGTKYYFSNQLKSGQISSPNENSRIGMLISICYKIKILIQSDFEILDFEKDFKAEIKNLTNTII